MKRRLVLTGLVATIGLSILEGGRAAAQNLHMESQFSDVWAAWRDAHLDATGRVVDELQQNASHSEGQGYGMFLAVTAGDRQAFDQIETWTQINLAIRPDNLCAWRWLPDTPERVSDLNNASDGDLFRAWALLRAAAAFDVPEYRERARRIVSDLVESCVVDNDGGPTPIFLPAVEGFRTGSGFVFNPSYAMPLAMTELATAFDMPRLAEAARSAVEIARQLAQDGVVPDWVEVSGARLQPASDFSFDAGYEAIRLPLFLVWSGLSTHPAVMRYAEAQTKAPDGMAATVIERSSGEILDSSPEAGYRAVAELSICILRRTVGSRMPPLASKGPYYPATLHFFAMIAQARSAPMCIPL